MKAPQSFVGHQVKDLIELHNTNHRFGFRIFRLQSAEDTVGKHIVDDPTIQSAIDRVPTLADDTIIMAEDYYGTYILRVRTIL